MASHDGKKLQSIIDQLARRPLEPSGVKVLTDTLEQLRWVQDLPPAFQSPAQKHPIHHLERLPRNAKVGCPGVASSYTHMATEKLFEAPHLSFYEEFTDVVDALLQGEVAFGVLPVENSSAGQVTEVLKLVSRNNLYICQTTEIKVEHCLCMHPDSDRTALTTAVSHPQALAQCQDYLRSRGLKPERYSNTSTAAQLVGREPGPMACVCSASSAALYGLTILEEGIQDFDENYTRFICVSLRNILLPGADNVSIALNIPHEAGYLNKLLTCFAACELDLTRLLSMPIASREFSVLFFLDFQGHVEDPKVDRLLSALYGETDFFQFLGNYSRLP